jgi:hypothetical protein
VGARHCRASTVRRMDAASPVGTAVTVRRALLSILICLWADRCLAGDNYALIVSGASGGAPYSAKYDGWRIALTKTLKSNFGYPDDHVLSLSEASRDQVYQAVRDLRTRVTKDDLLFVALIGHGSDEKFNLVGPDVTAADWAAQLKPIAGRIVFVDTTSSSFPFFHQLAAPGRIVITATESTAQQFETIFAEFFIKAFAEPSADSDKDGRVSIYEAFQYANANVRTWFDQHNQLPTEHAQIDNEGAARATFLQPRAVPANDPIAKRQAEIESAIADVKSRRSSMPPAAYDAEMERLLTDLARVAASLRSQ